MYQHETFPDQYIGNYCYFGMSKIAVVFIPLRQLGTSFSASSPVARDSWGNASYLIIEENRGDERHSRLSIRIRAQLALEKPVEEVASFSCLEMLRYLKRNV